jgi:hypothetical protein
MVVFRGELMVVVWLFVVLSTTATTAAESPAALRNDNKRRGNDRDKSISRSPSGMTTEEQRQGKDEIRGSLHCASDDEAV